MRLKTTQRANSVFPVSHSFPSDHSLLLIFSTLSYLVTLPLVFATPAAATVQPWVDSSHYDAVHPLGAIPGSAYTILPHSDPPTLPIRRGLGSGGIGGLERRSLADNSTYGAGIANVSFASDRQSYYTLIRVAGLMNFRISLDSASSDLWLISSKCDTSSCKGSVRYPLPFKSPTFQTVDGNNTAFSARYADGTVASGIVAKERIGLANFTLDNQVFGLVSETNTSLPDRISGVLGLGFPRLSAISGTVPDSQLFFTRLTQEGLLEYPLFGVSLDRNHTGTLSLGAIDGSIITDPSDIGWNRVAQFPPFGAENNVSSYLNWAIPLTGFAVNETSFTPLPTQTSQARPFSLALIDIGAAGIYGPYQDVSRIFETIPGSRIVDVEAGQWAVPCAVASVVSFTLGSKNYTLHPIDYLIGPVEGNPNICLSWPRALPPNNDGVDWQLGSAFLRTVYTIFNYGINGKEPPLVGFYSAPANNSTNATTTATISPSDALSSFFSAQSATVATTLPNFVLATPSFTATPSYIFNTSVPASIGGIVSTELANSTYTALFAQQTTPTNASAIPTIFPSPSVVTTVVTNSAGDVSTVVTTNAMAAVTLGLPGFSGAPRTSELWIWKAVVPSLAAMIWTMTF